MPTVKVFSRKIAYELIKKDHDLLDMEDNFKFPKYKIFVFRETPAILRDLDNLTKQK